MALVGLPTVTDSVVQNFFIEALGGPQDPLSYLERFPEEVYTNAIDSLLVRFLYALMGPTGVGQIRQEYLEARLQIEQAGLSTTSLDGLYTNAFAFARLASETYQSDAAAALLPTAERAQILSQDASFRNRAMDFLKGARAGGTLLGITLAAKSGLNRDVEVIENYRTLYDRYADLPLGLPSFGVTSLPAEAIVIPRQATPQSAVQTLSLVGQPSQGWFTLTYPVTQPWTVIPVTTTIGSPTITVPSAANIPAGVFVTLTDLATTSTSAQIDPTQPLWNHATLYAQSAGGAGTSLSLVYPFSALSLAGTPANASSTGSFVAFISLCQTTLLPYGATAAEVENALTALPSIGLHNVVCSGGPLPSQSITIQFVNALADQTILPLQVNVNADPVTGVTRTGFGGTEQLSDVTDDPINVVGLIKVQQAGLSTAGQHTTIAPVDEQAMQTAVRQIQPLTALITTQPGQVSTVPQQVNSSFTASNLTTVVRYVTGRSPFNWPPADATHWIEPAVEHEAPHALGTDSHQYCGFHNITNIQSYTEEALADPSYGPFEGLLHPGTNLNLNFTRYWNSLIGHFSPNQLILTPGLHSYNSGVTQFLPIGCLAAQTEPLVISNVGSQGVINDVYPVDYFSLPGIPQPVGGTLWASMERVDGIDYLEIDLGTVQPVNYLYFEATNKPYQIDISYDLLDQYPARAFYPVTFPINGLSCTSLSYNPVQLWSACTNLFTNRLNRMVYTRFLRIGFTRTPTGTPYGPVGRAVIPYSIEVRNLRIGRNVV